MVSIHEVRWKTANVTRNNLVVCESFVLCDPVGWERRPLWGLLVGSGDLCVWVLFIFGCEIGSHVANASLKTCGVAEDDLKLLIILLPHPECWDYSYVPPHQFIWC